MICACTVTSRAVVGSSAISSFGRQASAMAIITRWHMPPGELVRVVPEPLAGVGDADEVEQLRGAGRRRLARKTLVGANRLGDLPPDGCRPG